MKRKTRVSKKQQKRRVTRKQSKRQRKFMLRKQRGGAFSIPSVSKEYEDRTIVTVRPDSREPDSIPMTGTLTQMRKILEDADVGEA